jgi:hypothetical protein
MAKEHVECATPLERYFRRAEAAKYISKYYFPCSRNWLAKLACLTSDGPPFRKAGRIPLYSRSDVDVWAQSKLGPLLRSTSEVRRPIS